MSAVGSAVAASAAGDDTCSFARPKSSTVTRQSAPTMMLAGFRSRCVMPFAWAAARASASGMATATSRSGGSAARRDQAAQRLAFHEFHRYEPNAFRLLDGVDRYDVGVAQCRHGARFLFEAAEPLGVRTKSSGQDLDGDVAAEARIVGSIHLTHAAGAEQRHDFVGAEARAGGLILQHL